MSLRNNKAARLNRIMMFGTFFLGVIVLGCVFGFLYLSYDKSVTESGQPSQNGSAADSIIIMVSDSTVLNDLQ